MPTVESVRESVSRSPYLDREPEWHKTWFHLVLDDPLPVRRQSVVIRWSIVGVRVTSGRRPVRQDADREHTREGEPVGVRLPSSCSRTWIPRWMSAPSGVTRPTWALTRRSSVGMTERGVVNMPFAARQPSGHDDGPIAACFSV